MDAITTACFPASWPRTRTRGKAVRFRQSEDEIEWYVHIDHVVAVADAWVSGGCRWPFDGPKWVEFCNWPGNLLAVSSSANLSKGDSNAANWLPSNPVHDWRIRYVIMQSQVKAHFNLSLSESEAEAMRRLLETARA
ncbi:MAG: HNH endonuclease family protein [Bifidobacteriaceae bacterium]|nr:HNH endonuclease family protein [Bifidobacteriaceae bacterium]